MWCEGRSDGGVVKGGVIEWSGKNERRQRPAAEPIMYSCG